MSRQQKLRLIKLSTCAALVLPAAFLMTVSPALSKGLNIGAALKHDVEKVEKKVTKKVEAVEKTAKKAVEHPKETVKQVSKEAKKEVKAVGKEAKKEAVHAAAHIKKDAQAAGHQIKDVAEKTNASTGISKVATTSTKTLTETVEHPKETAKALGNDAKGLGKDAKTDAEDIAHGNVKKLLKDTANQENAVDAGISKGTGVSEGTLKTLNAMAGGAAEKMVVQAAEHPEATLKAAENDARDAESAARTDAEDIKQGNAAKLLRDVTNQQNAVIAAGIKTQVELSGVPVPKSVLDSYITWVTTVNSFSTGEGYAAVAEDLAHGKTGAALALASGDLNTLQGNGIENAVNQQIAEKTGISTAVSNTVEQIGLSVAGGGELAVTDDAARLVAEEAVKAGTEDAIKAGVKAATEEAAKAGAEQAAKTGAETASRDVAKDLSGEAAKRAIAKQLAEEAAAKVAAKALKAAGNDAAEAVAKTTAEEAAEIAAKETAKEATEVAAKDAAKDTANVAAKGFDGLLKDRLNAAAADAAKAAKEAGKNDAEIEAAAREAVEKTGKDFASEIGHYAKYTVKRGKYGPYTGELALREDAAMAGAKAMIKNPSAEAGAKAYAEYMARAKDYSGAIEDISAKVSGKMTVGFVAKSLAKVTAKIAAEKGAEKAAESTQDQSTDNGSAEKKDN